MMKFTETLSWLVLGVFLLIVSIVYFIINLLKDGSVDWGTIAVFLIGTLMIYLFSRKKATKKRVKESSYNGKVD